MLDWENYFIYFFIIDETFKIFSWNVVNEAISAHNNAIIYNRIRNIQNERIESSSFFSNLNLFINTFYYFIVYY